MDEGWDGPPFDILDLAERLGIDTIPTEDVRDARIVPTGQRFRIEFNPNRPPSRIRYSVAHEIAHTLFSDCADAVREREDVGRGVGDEWQLEALCNIAAAELLMPAGSLPGMDAAAWHLENVLDLRDRFEVSTEAMCIRLVQLSSVSCAMFCASRLPLKKPEATWQVDYMIPSRNWGLPVRHRWELPSESVAPHCTGVGHTWKGRERWWGRTPELDVEAVGIPPYPGSRFPRVVGLVRPSVRIDQRGAEISYVHGDATQPAGAGVKLVVHVVNDKTANWGGAGFARALKRKWPKVQEDFRVWTKEHGLRSSFGQVRFFQLDQGISVASMICQRGYGPAPTPRIRYGAMRDCLSRVTDYAKAEEMTVHMPRIGSGEAGGRWSVAEELIMSTLAAGGVRVTVYDLPGTKRPPEPQSYLPFASFQE